MVFWASLAPGAFASSIFFQRYHANGAPAGGETALNASQAAFQPSVAALPNGGFVLVWAEGPQFNVPWQYRSQRFGANGAPAGLPQPLATTTVDFTSKAKPTVLSDGSYLITWAGRQTGGAHSTDVSHAYVQRYDSAGAPVGGETRVSGSSESQTSIAATALPGGGFMVAWKEIHPAGGWKILTRRFDNTGAAIEEPVELATDEFLDNLEFTRLVDGRHVLVWEAFRPLTVDGRRIVQAQVFDSGGGPMAAEIEVASRPANFHSRPANLATQPKVAALGDGGFVVTWMIANWTGAAYDRDLFAQRFDAAGLRLGDALSVSTIQASTSTGIGESHSVAGAGDSSFLAVTQVHSVVTDWDVIAARR